MYKWITDHAKALVSLVWLGLAVASMFVFVDPSFKQACIALVPAVIGVITVFHTKNATPDAVDKAVMQLVTAVVAVVVFWIKIPADTIANIGILVAAFASSYTVWLVPNTKNLHVRKA